jgi:hypothetical protein
VLKSEALRSPCEHLLRCLEQHAERSIASLKEKRRSSSAPGAKEC